MDQNYSANEAVASVAAASARDETARPTTARPYTEGARRSRQFKTTDLIPKRRWPLSALVIALLLAIVALNGIQYSIPSMEVTVGPAVASAFALESPRGLSTWYCNLLLLFSAAACIQIYLLRQHRRDDYRGTYRVWLWYAAVFVLASMASVTSLSEVFSQSLQKLVGPIGSSAFWPSLILFTGLSVLVVRGFFEVRRSRLAVIALVTIFLALAGTFLLQLVPAIASSISEFVPAAHGNLVLIAASSLLFGTIGFARFVYLEANGLIQVASDKESSAEKKSVRAAIKNAKKAEQAKKKSDHESKRKRAAERSLRDSGKDQSESETTATAAGSQKAGTKASASLLSKRLERNSGRPDNRVGSGQKLEQRANSMDADDDIPSGISKSELRRLRKQKRRAA